MMQDHLRGQLHSKKGTGLIEVTVVLICISILMTSIITHSRKVIKMSIAEKTLTEMNSLAEASINFIKTESATLNNINQLSDYISATVTQNPYGQQYQITSEDDAITVSTLVPQGEIKINYIGSLFEIQNLGQLDQISITKPINQIMTGRLAYDKKYVYKQ